MRTLEQYFERIEAAMAAGEVILARRDPAEAGTVKAKCTEAALLIASYHMFVHREVFEPMTMTRDEILRRQVCALKAECIALTEDLRAGVKTMAANDLPIDFAATSARVEWFNDRVRRHIVAVQALLATAGSGLRVAA